MYNFFLSIFKFTYFFLCHLYFAFSLVALKFQILYFFLHSRMSHLFAVYSFYFSADISNCFIIVGIFSFTSLSIVLIVAFKIPCLLILTSGFFLDSVSVLFSFWGWVTFSLFFILQGFWILRHSEYCVVHTVFCYIPLKNVDCFWL